MAYSQLHTLETRVKSIEEKVALYERQLSDDAPISDGQQARIRAAIRHIFSEKQPPYRHSEIAG